MFEAFQSNSLVECHVRHYSTAWTPEMALRIALWGTGGGGSGWMGDGREPWKHRVEDEDGQETGVDEDGQETGVNANVVAERQNRTVS